MKWELITPGVQVEHIRHFKRGFLLFRLGDTRTGWIPEQATLDAFDADVRQVTDMPFLIYTYAVKVKYIRNPGIIRRLWYWIF
jgi:hypothetical protein